MSLITLLRKLSHRNFYSLHTFFLMESHFCDKGNVITTACQRVQNCFPPSGEIFFILRSFPSFGHLWTFFLTRRQSYFHLHFFLFSVSGRISSPILTSQISCCRVQIRCRWCNYWNRRLQYRRFVSWHSRLALSTIVAWFVAQFFNATHFWKLL